MRRNSSGAIFSTMIGRGLLQGLRCSEKKRILRDKWVEWWVCRSWFIVGVGLAIFSILSMLYIQLWFVACPQNAKIRPSCSSCCFLGNVHDLFVCCNVYGILSSTAACLHKYVNVSWRSFGMMVVCILKCKAFLKLLFKIWSTSATIHALHFATFGFAFIGSWQVHSPELAIPWLANFLVWYSLESDPCLL